MSSGTSLIIGLTSLIVVAGYLYLVYTAATRKHYKHKVLIVIATFLLWPLGLFILSSPDKNQRPKAPVVVKRFLIPVVPAYLVGLSVSFFAAMAPPGLRSWLGSQYAKLLKMFYEGRVSLFVDGNSVDFGTYQLQIFFSFFSVAILCSTGLLLAAGYWRFRWTTAVAFVSFGLFLGCVHEFLRAVSVAQLVISNDINAAESLMRVRELPLLELMVLLILGALLAFRIHLAQMRQT